MSTLTPEEDAGPVRTRSSRCRRQRKTPSRGSIDRRYRGETANSWSATRQRAVLFLVLLLYVAVLRWSYETQIAPAFSYMGLRYREPDLLNYIAAFMMAYLVGLVVPNVMKYASDFIVWILYVMACVPSIVVPQYANIVSPSRALQLAFFVALSFAMVAILANKGPQGARTRPPRSAEILWIVLLGISVVTYSYMYFTTGLSFRFINPTAVKDVRFQYRETVAVSGSLLPYLIGLQGNVINPILVCRGVHAKRWAMVIAGAAGQLLIYSATGYKIILLSVPAALLVLMMFWMSRRRFGRLILYGTLASSIVSVALDRITGGLAFTAIFVSRLLIIPGALTAAYFKYFQYRPKAQWGYSFMAPFVDYPYNTTPDMLVGLDFSGMSQVTANASLFADGYGNLGYLGIFVEAGVLVLLLWIINMSAAHLPLSVSALILLVPSLALVNASVFTSILTSGYAAAVVLMFLLPRTGWGKLSDHDVEMPPGSTREGGGSALLTIPRDLRCYGDVRLDRSVTFAR